MIPNSPGASTNDAAPAKKIGVLGGTFDPIHNGHLAVGKFAMREAGLDEVVFVPAGRPWMKQTEPGASPEDRLEMVRLALEGQPGMTCSDVDVVRPGHTYTVDTLTDLRLQYGPGAAFYLIVGADTAEDMHRWDRAELLPSLCTVVVIGRPGSPIPTEVERGHPARGALFLQGPMREVSASAIRDCLNGGGLPLGRIPLAVARYMDERGLYGLSRETEDLTERVTTAEKAARLLERAMELGALEIRGVHTIVGPDEQVLLRRASADPGSGGVGPDLLAVPGRDRKGSRRRCGRPHRSGSANCRSDRS